MVRIGVVGVGGMVAAGAGAVEDQLLEAIAEPRTELSGEVAREVLGAGLGLGALHSDKILTKQIIHVDPGRQDGGMPFGVSGWRPEDPPSQEEGKKNPLPPHEFTDLP